MDETRILLVEDNALLREWIRSSLQDRGFRVAATESVAEALRLAGDHAFDVLVTDWHLPEGYDGFEVLACVRKKLPGVFSILISADADSEVAARARTAGFNDVLQKPFPPWRIAAAIQGLVREPEKVAV